MSKHTPGPWFIRPGDEWTNSIVTRHDDLPNGEPCCWEVASFNKRRDEAEANARLIAAAPDLLEALKTLLDAASVGHYPFDETKGWKHPALQAARSAITKATQENTK